MRLVHLSDVHLGYRQYQRLTPGGVNQREADVAATFRAAIDLTIRLEPDLVIIAGDVFHSVRPTNQAILHAFLQLSRLVHAVPSALVVLVAGDHDTPRSAETGGILQLFAQLGAHVVDREARWLSFADRGLSVLAIPGVRGLVVPSPQMNPDARFNVMVAHGNVPGAVPETAADPAAIAIPRQDFVGWDYVALGHYHVYREIAPNAFYSGSIDYTSVNTWGELHEERDAGLKGKGLIEHDLVTGEHVFHPLPPSRPLIDLSPINARGLTAADLDERIRSAVDGCSGEIDDKIVRLTAWDVPRHIARELDHKAIRDYKRRALNFHLDIRRPDIFRIHSAGAPGRRQTVDLKDIVAEKLRTRPLDSDIDRDALIARAMSYIDEAHLGGIAPAALTES